MDIKYELQRRSEDEDETYSLLGAEIKKHRLAKSATLKAVASDNCSVSYLCKIERNQIKASPKHLREICEKVGISEEKTNYLLGSRDLLIDAVRIFYFRDLKTLEEVSKKLRGLDNHRVILIRLIFALTKNDLGEAKKCINRLYKLTSNLATLDLTLFGCFYGVYSYLTGNYLEAADYLKIALDDTLGLEYIDAISLIYLFKTANITGSYNQIYYYKSLEDLALKYGNNLDLELIHRNMAYFYILSENYSEYLRILRKIKDFKIKTSLDYIYNIRLENNKEVDPLNLDEVALAYYKIYNNHEDTTDYIQNSNLRSELKYYLNYLELRRHSIEKSYDYLMEIAFPLAIKKDLYFFADFYLEEMAISIHRPNKYKRFLDMYLELNMIKKLVLQI